MIPRDQAKGVVVIGTVQGDIHDFGKNLVAAILQSGGFHVIDLGRDVPLKKFLSVAKEKEVDVVAVSALMTPALDNIERLIMMIKEQKLAVKTIIGGLATSEEFAREVGADCWAEDALKGLEMVRNFIQEKRLK